MIGVLLFAFIVLQQGLVALARAARWPKRAGAAHMNLPHRRHPTRRAHSNHAEVARSIGVDIIAGRYAEGTRLPAMPK